MTGLMSDEKNRAAFDQMWYFLTKFGQKANIPRLKGYVNDLITLTTQKSDGEGKHAKSNTLPFSEIDMTMMSIVIEATALVLSGQLDKLEGDNG